MEIQITLRELTELLVVVNLLVVTIRTITLQKKVKELEEKLTKKQ